MVEIQLETYTPEAISAHRKIRQDIFCLLALYHPHGLILCLRCLTLATLMLICTLSSLCLVFFLKSTLFSHFREKLNAELKACQAEKLSIDSKLSSFEILGKEFEALAEEYCRLRQEIEMKKWALKEFAHYSNKQN